MRKSIFILVALILQNFCYGQQKVFIDLTKSDKKPLNKFYKISDKYYIILAAHAAKKSDDPKIKSFAGHAWVIWGRENNQTKKSEISGYGFWPDYDKIKSEYGKDASIVLGTASISDKFLDFFQLGGLHVFGKLNNDLLGLDYENTLKQIVLEVDKDVYDQSLKVIDKYKIINPDYKLLENDCVSFMIEVGRSIGLGMPNRGLLDITSWYPIDYFNIVEKMLTYPNAMPLIVQEDNLIAEIGYIKNDKSGNYKVVFDLSSKNYNSCYKDYWGNLVQEKFRNNELSCKQINYKNGDIWYSEPKPNNSIPNDAIQIINPNISEYTFENGNTILGYNPFNFNPNFVAVNLNSGNESYLGEINNLGFPNGKGTLNKYEESNNGIPKSNSKTGIFSNGTFLHYEGIKNDIGTLYGEFVNGELNGEARIEFNDGRIYTGNFKKGKADKQGTAITTDGTIIKGTFENGIPNGVCTIQSKYGFYKGEAKNGLCSGNAIWSQPNGNLYEGNFENGFIVDGKLTFPNGDYFVGKFNSGIPSRGKIYDKNGNELKEKENRAGEIDRKKQTGNDGLTLGPGSYGVVKQNDLPEIKTKIQLY